MLKLAHLSDPHLPLPDRVDWRDLMNKRVTGYVSWHRHRRSVHDPRVLTALKADLEETKPDHMVVTGDLTNLALPAEFDRAIDWLAKLGRPEDISVIPGNHDAYIEIPWSQSFGRLAAYMTQIDEELKTEASSFPFIRKIGRIAVVGVSGLAGTAIGLLAGWHGGLLDAVIMRLVDVFLAFPGILLAIALAGVLGPGAGNVVIALAVAL